MRSPNGPYNSPRGRSNLRSREVFSSRKNADETVETTINKIVMLKTTNTYKWKHWIYSYLKAKRCSDAVKYSTAYDWNNVRFQKLVAQHIPKDEIGEIKKPELTYDRILEFAKMNDQAVGYIRATLIEPFTSIYENQQPLDEDGEKMDWGAAVQQMMAMVEDHKRDTSTLRQQFANLNILWF